MLYKNLLALSVVAALAACGSNPEKKEEPKAAAPAPVAAKPAAAPVAAAPAAAPAKAGALKLTPTPAGKLGIHYFRKAKDWAPGDFAKCDFASCWGLHVWGDAYDSDTSWFKPIFPVGTDEFGAVYHLKANEDKEIAATAEANYILHKGDSKDQCSKDMAWDHTKAQEIFVVQDDCKVYLTLEDAMKSPNYPK